MPFRLKSNAVSIPVQDPGNPDFGEQEGSRVVELPNGTLNFMQCFARGVRMMYTEYTMREYAVLDWEGDIELVTMYFSLKGKFSVLGGGMNSPLVLESNQHNMFYGREAQGSLFLEELRMKAFMVQFTKEAFLEIANDADESLGRFADEVAAGRTTLFSEKNLHIDLAIQSCIDSVINSGHTGAQKRMFCYSKALELLVLQAESLRRMLSPQPRYVKSDYDRERILFARDYLVQHMELPPSLAELSRIAGINEFKLKRGFREVFGHSVFGYLNELRMELAKNDLLEKRKSVTEIAFELGFSSVQHFSTAFRKRFGIPPSRVE